MATQKLTKAQQSIIDAMKAGATLGHAPQSNTYYLSDAGEFRTPNWRTVNKLIELKLIKRLPNIPGRNYIYGLTTVNSEG